MELLVAAALCFYLVGEPVLVALHELGHAVVPVARGRETAVFVGGEVGPTARRGTLTVTVAPRGFLAPVTYGATATDVDVDRATVLGGALGGPAISLVLLAGAWQLLGVDASGLVGDRAAAVVGGLAVLAVVYLAFQTAFTLLPLRYPGWTGQYGDYRSDGMIVLDAVLGRGADGDGD